jgi:predicted porin
MTYRWVTCAIAVSRPVALVCLALGARQALAQVKDPLPDSLSLGGVTLYATIDVGYAYQSNGVPLSSQWVGGLEYQSFTTTRNFSGPQSTVAESGMEQSKIGLRVSQPIGNNLTLIARTDTGFNPLSGQLVDGCASIVTNSGKPQGQQTANADTSRCGQPFNGVIWGGISHSVYGALTIGRQNSLQLDALAQYDPQGLSYAFSVLGFSGLDAGAGSTEGARWDNSIRYAYQHGPARVTVMYSNGGLDTGLLGKSYGVDAGSSWGALAVDAVFQHEKGAVNLRSSFNNPVNPVPVPGLSAFISNNTSYNLMAKYAIDLGALVEKSKLTVYGGYSHMKREHGDYVPGAEAQNNYPITVPINVNNPAVYNMEWLGAKYEPGSAWNFTVGLYHLTQNNWTIGRGVDGRENTGCSAAGLLCSGDFNEASLVLDYVLNKHYDAYAGVNYSEVTNGLASGFKGTPASGTSGSENQTTIMFGFRIRI